MKTPGSSLECNISYSGWGLYFLQYIVIVLNKELFC